MEFVKQAEKKRGATEDLEGPRRKDQDGEPREEAGVPMHLWEKRELVNLRRRRPVGPDKMPLPLQQVDAMT